MKVTVQVGLLLALMVVGVFSARAQSAGAPVQPAEVSLPVEVFQVLEMPLAINNAALVKTKDGYLVKCSLTNSSEFRQLGLRYSLFVVNSPGPNRSISVNEGFTLAPYRTKTVAFKTPLKLKLNGNERLVLMLEQLISTDYVWNVINPTDALAAYVTGDYTITPQVLRVRNQVDPPPQIKLLY